MPAPRKYVDQAPPSAADRQQASRARKRAAGARLVQIWLDADSAAALDRLASAEGLSGRDLLQRLVKAQLRED